MNPLPIITKPEQLAEIYAVIESRVQAAREAQPTWPCRAGCDACCRSLAQPPQLSSAEWDRLQAGIQRLPQEVQAVIEERIQSLVSWETSPNPAVVCPLLDIEARKCQVYADRPAACRTYGYYVARHNHQWCDLIEEMDRSGAFEGVTLGNYAAICRQLSQRCGPSRSLIEWFLEN